MDRLTIILVRERGTVERPPEVIARVADPVVAALAARVAVTQACERQVAFAAAGDPLAGAVRDDAERLVRELRPLLGAARDCAEATYTASQVTAAAGIAEPDLAALHGCGLRSAGWRERAHDAVRVYTVDDAIAASVAHRLIARGIQPRRAAEIADDTRPYHGEPRYWLAVQPPGEWRGATTPDALPRGRDVIIVRVHDVAAEVRERLEALAR